MTEVLEFKDFRWLDVFDPDPPELAALAETYQLHPTSIEDTLEPEHLPKAETFDNVTFLVWRAFNPECHDKCATVRDLTRKVAIFYGPKFLLTIHPRPSPYVDKVRATYAARPDVGTAVILIEHVIADLIGEIVMSFKGPLTTCQAQLETFENEIFGHGTRKRFRLQNSYYLRRRAAVLRHVLRTSLEPLARLQLQTPAGAAAKKLAPAYQNLREQIEAQLFGASDVGDNLTALINLHLSLQGQRSNEASRRTNEVMRVLTIFSCFFLPINFIAAIYGMNFEFLPEVHMKYGYPLSLLMMVATGALTWEWFRRRGWLKGTRGPSYEP